MVFEYNKMSISKIASITGYSLLFLVIIFIISGIFLTIYFNKKIIESVKEQVSESTQGKYALVLDGLTINILTHSITINNLTIAPTGKEISAKAQYVFKAKVLRIIDFSIMPYLRKRDLIIDRVEFEEPQISIFQGIERMPMKKTDSTSTNFSLYTIFSKKMNSISIGQIDVMNSKFNIYKHGTDTLSVLSTNDNSISIKNFRVNSETNKNSRLFLAEKFEIVMNNVSYHLGNGLYTLYGKSIHASYIDSSLIVDSLQLIPNFSKKEFADVAGRQISRVKIISSKVNFQKMDVKLFFEYNWLVIHKVELTACAMDIYRDNTLPLKHIVRPSIQAMLKSLPFYVAVDTIEMKNGEAIYEVLNPGTVSLGKFSLNRINATITGVQNDTSTYSEKNYISLKLNANFQNQGKFFETFTFPLNTTKEFFYCSGSLTSMPMASFNSLLLPAKQISIISGQLDHASFSFAAHENSADGTMKFMYHDLKVEVMNKNNLKNGIKVKLKTFLMNKLIIKESNPGKNGIVRISTIHVEHNPYRYFTYYSIQAMLSGVAPAIEGGKMIKVFQKKK